MKIVKISNLIECEGISSLVRLSSPNRRTDRANRRDAQAKERHRPTYEQPLSSVLVQGLERLNLLFEVLLGASVAGLLERNLFFFSKSRIGKMTNF